MIPLFRSYLHNDHRCKHHKLYFVISSSLICLTPPLHNPFSKLKLKELMMHCDPFQLLHNWTISDVSTNSARPGRPHAHRVHGNTSQEMAL